MSIRAYDQRVAPVQLFCCPQYICMGATYYVTHIVTKASLLDTFEKFMLYVNKLLHYFRLENMCGT